MHTIHKHYLKRFPFQHTTVAEFSFNFWKWLCEMKCPKKKNISRIMCMWIIFGFYLNFFFVCLFVCSFVESNCCLSNLFFAYFFLEFIYKKKKKFIVTTMPSHLVTHTHRYDGLYTHTLNDRLREEIQFSI